MKFSIQKVKLRFDEQQIGKRIHLCLVLSVSILVLVCGLFLHFFFHSMVDKACNKLQEIFSKTSLVKKKGSFALTQLFHSLKLKTSRTATALCLRRQQKIHLTKCFSQSRIPTSNKTKDYEISSSYTNGSLPLSHVRTNLFTYSNLSQILDSFQHYF